MPDGPSDTAAKPLAGRTLGVGDRPTFVLEEGFDDGSYAGVPVAPLHRHLDEDEAWYVLEGRLIVRVGEALIDAGPGDAVIAPRGASHTFWNAGPGATRYLLIAGPSTARLVGAIHDGVSRDREHLAALFRSHGAELLEES